MITDIFSVAVMSTLLLGLLAGLLVVVAGAMQLIDKITEDKDVL